MKDLGKLIYEEHLICTISVRNEHSFGQPNTTLNLNNAYNKENLTLSIGEGPVGVYSGNSKFNWHYWQDEYYYYFVEWCNTAN